MTDLNGSLTGAGDGPAMHRRAIITAGLASLAAAPALAAPDTGSAAPPEVDLLPVGVPVIVDGRVRNYVFVRVRLHLAPDADVAAVTSKEPFFREAIVRAAHQRPFTLPGDLQSVNAARLEAAVMHVAPRLAGQGAVLRAETLSQAPRRRMTPR